MVTFEPMTEADIGLIRSWLGQPHVARWYLAASTVERELADVAASLDPDVPTEVLIVIDDDGRPIGWCQWYLCRDYPEHAAGVGAEPDDLGIDYAIGEPTAVGRGVGTRLIGALLARLRSSHPGCGVIADPEVGNAPSRRVLEKNGFILMDERPVSSEPGCGPMAVYRLDHRR